MTFNDSHDLALHEKNIPKKSFFKKEEIFKKLIQLLFKFEKRKMFLKLLFICAAFCNLASAKMPLVNGKCPNWKNCTDIGLKVHPKDVRNFILSI